MWLIDADKLLKTLDQYVNPAPNAYHTGFQDGIATAISEVEDAEDIPTGTWEFRCGGSYNRTKAYCTACGKPSGIGGIRSNQAKPYCPNCGVKMKLEVGGRSE